MGSFRSARAKLARAEKHLEELRALLATCREGRYRLVPEYDDVLGILFHRIEITPKPPIGLSIVAGDILFGLRCALDHAVWDLVRASGGEPGRHHQFPIVFSESAFHEKRCRSQLEGLPEAAEALIERAQPYHAGQGLLWVLGRLHNADKHCALHVLVASAADVQIEFPFGLRLRMAGMEFQDGARFGGTGIRLEMFPGGLKRFSEVEMQGECPLLIHLEDVAEDGGEGPPVDELLDDLIRMVRQLLAELAEAIQ